MIDLVKYILKEVDFNEIIIPYEIVDLYQIADDRKQKSEGKKYLIMVLKALNFNISTFVALAYNVLAKRPF